MSEALKVNTTLTTLDLGGTSIRNKAPRNKNKTSTAANKDTGSKIKCGRVRALCEALEENTALTELGFEV